VTDVAAQTWHYGLVARWWAEFNLDGPEIDFFRPYVEAGQPALDAACGTGRLLVPYLHAGLDVDGSDISADMLALARERAVREGFAPPNLYAQAMHELDLPRRYRTIFVCGAFGLGSTRAQDEEALRRFRAHLEPGGTLLVDIEVPYADARQWPLWTKAGREALPQEPQAPEQGDPASDGAEYGLRSRYLGFDPLGQRVSLEMTARRWRDGTLEAEETHRLDIGIYFANELRLMLEQAGFDDVVVHGDHVEAPPTPDDDFVVLVARTSTG